MNNYSQLFGEFKQQYANTPGVLSIEENTWFEDTFVLYIDTNKFQRASIPDQYKDVPIWTVDVRAEEASLKQLLIELKKQGAPDQDPTMTMFRKHLIKMNELIGEDHINIVLVPTL